MEALLSEATSWDMDRFQGSRRSHKWESTGRTQARKQRRKDRIARKQA